LRSAQIVSDPRSVTRSPRACYDSWYRREGAEVLTDILLEVGSLAEAGAAASRRLGGRLDLDSTTSK
jgi:hypothetical protein